jgi:hypothetical protein
MEKANHMKAKKAKKEKKVKKEDKVTSSSSKNSSKKRTKADDDDDLDDLFAEVRKKKKMKAVADAEEAAETKDEGEKAELSGPPPEEPKGTDYGRIKSNIQIKVDPRITNPEAPIHRWDKESGLPVYKAAALKAFTEESGGTEFCPFDCNCCF